MIDLIAVSPENPKKSGSLVTGWATHASKVCSTLICDWYAILRIPKNAGGEKIPN